MTRLFIALVLALSGCRAAQQTPCDVDSGAAVEQTDSGAVGEPDSGSQVLPDAGAVDSGAVELDAGPALVDPADACTRLERAYGERAAMLMETPFGCPATDARCQLRAPCAPEDIDACLVTIASATSCYDAANALGGCACE